MKKLSIVFAVLALVVVSTFAQVQAAEQPKAVITGWIEASRYEYLIDPMLLEVALLQYGEEGGKDAYMLHYDSITHPDSDGHFTLNPKNPGRPYMLRISRLVAPSTWNRPNEIHPDGRTSGTPFTILLPIDFDVIPGVPLHIEVALSPAIPEWLPDDHPDPEHAVMATCKLTYQYPEMPVTVFMRNYVFSR